MTDAFAWGSIFADFTNNERLDLVVTENFAGYPLNLAKHFNDLVIGNLSGPLRVLLNDLSQDDDVTTQGDM